MFWGAIRPFSTTAAPFYILTNKDFCFSTSSPTFLPFLFYFFSSHPHGCEVLSHRSFDLQFPNHTWCWTSFLNPSFESGFYDQSSTWFLLARASSASLRRKLRVTQGSFWWGGQLPIKSREKGQSGPRSRAWAVQGAETRGDWIFGVGPSGDSVVRRFLLVCAGQLLRSVMFILALQGYLCTCCLGVAKGEEGIDDFHLVHIGTVVFGTAFVKVNLKWC